MKKAFYISMALLAIAFSAGAQDVNDAYNFASMEYSGTARSIALGNAMTAVGGDLGSLTLNPAGSAVAGYGQITFSPGITVSKVSAVGTPLTGSTNPYSYGDHIHQSSTRMAMPNIGTVFHINMGNRYGLKSLSIGFVSNQTNNFFQHAVAKGSNANTSLAGAIAAASEGLWYEGLEGDNAYNGSAAWRSIVGYQSGLTALYADYGDSYIGVTEKVWPDGSIGLAGNVNQVYQRLVYGNKYYFLINVCANVSDRFYLGANLGLASISYNYKLAEQEISVDPDQFGLEFDNGSIKYFDSFTYRNNWSASASGAYLKVGFIAKPIDGLRLGAAIQTPTLYTVREQFAQDATVYYMDGSDSWAQTPEGTAQYRLVTPFRANAGIAFTFGTMGLLSADYEYCDYSGINYRDNGSSFGDLNADIRNFLGVSHELRTGAEIKPTPAFALRAGYAFTTSPQKYDNGEYIKAPRQLVSAGLGYSSNGSFFADFAVKLSLLPNEYVMAYEDYIDNVLSPEIEISTRRIGAVLTLGWRF